MTFELVCGIVIKKKDTENIASPVTHHINSSDVMEGLERFVIFVFRDKTKDFIFFALL